MDMPPEQSSEVTGTEPAAAAASVDDGGERRRVGEVIREAWSQALVAVSATEEEVQKIVGRVTAWVEMGPEEARRLGAELSDRLRKERDELESSLDLAVRRALTPFRLPSREELNALTARLGALDLRIEQVLAKRSVSNR
jgi:polyhydroxyalkanoate synthesis regulator phasin